MQNVAALKVRQQTDPCPLGNTTYKSGAANYSYLYDANGNLQSGAGRSLTFNRFNMPQTVTLGSQVTTFGYGPSLERLTKTVTNGAASETTLYIEGLYERRTSGASTTQRYYVPAGDRLVAVAVDTGAGPVNYSVHTDRLGSMDVIANSARLAANDLRFDAWGLRTDGTAAASLLTPRGYTGHELDSDSGLINMNARLYDPLLGRFVSADTVLPDPFDLQSVNRYSYVLNNPFRYTDPSGHEYIGTQNGVAGFNDGTGMAGMVATYNVGSGEYSFADGSRIDAQGTYFAPSSYGVTLYVNTATNWADGTQWTGVGPNFSSPGAAGVSVSGSSQQTASPSPTSKENTSGWGIAWDFATTYVVENFMENFTGIGGLFGIAKWVNNVEDVAKGTGNAANNAADGLRLNKSLASQSQMSEAGTIMAGPGGRVPFRDAPRVAEQYGGSASDWVKKTSPSYTARDGAQFETHWVENIKTGQRVEFKTKFPGGE